MHVYRVFVSIFPSKKKYLKKTKKFIKNFAKYCSNSNCCLCWVLIKLRCDCDSHNMRDVGVVAAPWSPLRYVSHLIHYMALQTDGGGTLHNNVCVLILIALVIK